MSQSDCSCTGSSLDRFVRPSVLAVLAEHDAGLHGYAIARALQGLALFGDAPPDMTGLYRVLKSMEAEGYLVSSWCDEGHGPARNVYCITASGRECLGQWAQTLKVYTEHLASTVDYIAQQARTAAVPVDACAGASCQC